MYNRITNYLTQPPSTEIWIIPNYLILLSSMMSNYFPNEVVQKPKCISKVIPEILYTPNKDMQMLFSNILIHIINNFYLWNFNR